MWKVFVEAKDNGKKFIYVRNDVTNEELSSGRVVSDDKKEFQRELENAEYWASDLNKLYAELEVLSKKYSVADLSWAERSDEQLVKLAEMRGRFINPKTSWHKRSSHWGVSYEYELESLFRKALEHIEESFPGKSLGWSNTMTDVIHNATRSENISKRQSALSRGKAMLASVMDSALRYKVQRQKG